MWTTYTSTDQKQIDSIRGRKVLKEEADRDSLQEDWKSLDT